MRRLLLAVSTMLVLNAFVVPTPAYAQQSLNLFVGMFVPRGLDARVDGDVLLNNRAFFLFDMGKFKDWTGGADWLIALNQHVEVGLGLGIYSEEVPSTYADLVNENGSRLSSC